MPLSAYAEKAALDWLLLGATPTRPSQNWLGLSWGTPNSTSASELGTGQARYTRATIDMAAAQSPAGIVALSVAVSFSSFVAGSTIVGWQIWDTQGVGAGNMLMCGVFSAATLPGSASGFTIGTANLTAL